MTTQLMLVPLNESPEHGVVICRPSSQIAPSKNIWKSKVVYESPYRELSEVEAQIHGLKMKPGTMMPSEIDDLRTSIQNRYNVDIAKRTVGIGNSTMALTTFLKDYTHNVPDGWPVWRTDPFKLWRWI